MDPNEKSLTELLVQRLWTSEHCPIFDGIILDTGQMHHFDPASVLTPEKTSSTKNELISDYLGREGNHCSTLSAFGKHALGQDSVIFGEGSHGSDGFVALVNEAQRHLHWIFFSQKLNPIYRVETDRDAVTGISTTNYRIRIPLSSPANFSIALETQ